MVWNFTKNARKHLSTDQYFAYFIFLFFILPTSDMSCVLKIIIIKGYLTASNTLEKEKASIGGKTQTLFFFSPTACTTVDCNFLFAFR